MAKVGFGLFVLIHRQGENGLPSRIKPAFAFRDCLGKAAQSLHRNVPETLRLATRYDGSRAKLAEPPLTAVDLHLDALAKLAVDLLIQTIDDQKGEGSSAPMPRLIPRQSSGK